jgi:kumamolisin
MPTTPVTIGVVSFGGGLYGDYNTTTKVLTSGDVQTYWSDVCEMTDLPKVLVVPLEGASNDPAGDAGGTGENTLDVTTIGACYPSSTLTIVLYVVPNTTTNFYKVFEAAINGITVNGQFIKSDVISCSWGQSEKNWGEYSRVVNTLFAKANARGIVISCASGDYGSSNGETGINVDFPASSPHVIACGGTSLVCPNRVWDAMTVETVWNVNPKTSATGGGVSTFFVKPPYQKSLPGTKRTIPDIAMNADPTTGTLIRVNGKMDQLWGGTSIVSPAMSAFVARCRPKKCNVAALYKVPIVCFNDITKGNNGAYKAGRGFDKCSGRGSLKGKPIKNSL